MSTLLSNPHAHIPNRLALSGVYHFQDGSADCSVCLFHPRKGSIRYWMRDLRDLFFANLLHWKFLR